MQNDNLNCCPRCLFSYFPFALSNQTTQRQFHPQAHHHHQNIIGNNNGMRLVIVLGVASCSLLTYVVRIRCENQQFFPRYLYTLRFFCFYFFYNFYFFFQQIISYTMARVKTFNISEKKHHTTHHICILYVFVLLHRIISICIHDKMLLGYLHNFSLQSSSPNKAITTTRMNMRCVAYLFVCNDVWQWIELNAMR